MRALIFLFILLAINVIHAAKPNKAMVVSEQKVASQIGVDVLQQGGNAVDAAVAVGYALAVVNPCCGNIGGGGFMTIHLANGKNIFINFREKAPIKASKKMFLDKSGNLIADKSSQGYSSVAVPGTVQGLDTALRKYGTMTREKVISPAIKLAENGYQVTPYDVKLFNQYADRFRNQPNVSSIFLKEGNVCQAGDYLKQTDLAKTLKLISKKGADAFYRGDIAKKIVNASEEHDGILMLRDFNQYQVKIMTPLQCDYRSYHIISAPPPSSGGVTLCEALHILENFPLKQLGYESPERIRIIIEALRYAYADRNSQLGDPDFVVNPVSRLIDKKYVEQFSDKIKRKEKSPHKAKALPELTDTTHYSIVDNKGNAVSVTYTLNGFFGAGVIADDTGFFLNNEMDDFAALPGEANKFGLVQYNQNSIESQKRPLSSMSPTIVMKDGKVVMVLGSPGGPRIISAVLLTLLNVIDYNMPLQEAIDAPRFHYQGEPDVVNLEPDALSPKIITELQKQGYVFAKQKPWAAVEAITINPKTGEVIGANDKRRPSGAALGY
jgi:gamma-glutamyltranspeptidase/glutathione hydrolase